MLEIGTFLLLRLFLLALVTPSDALDRLPVPPVLAAQMTAANAVWASGAALVLFLLLRFGAGYAINRHIFRTILARQTRIASGLFDTYLGQPYVSQASDNVSRRKQTIFQTVTAVVHQLMLPFSQFVVELITAVAIIVMLLWIEPLASLALLTWILLIVAVAVVVTSRFSTEIGQDRWDTLNQMRDTVDAAMGDARIVKLSGKEHDLSDRFARKAALHQSAVGAELGFAHMLTYSRELVFATSLCVVVAVLTLQGGDNTRIVASLAVFAAASVRLFPAFQRIVSLGHKIRSYAPDLGRILDDRLIDSEHVTLQVPSPKAAAPLFRTSLELENIGYTYPGANKAILRNVDLAIRPRDRIEITGPSGSGKSTLLLILCGLIRSDSGTVSIDGTCDDVLQRMRAGEVLLVPQDPFVLNASIAANIAFPDPAETLDRELCARLLAEFGLPHALDDHPGEHGRKISGGEKQKLALVRAISRQPELLILDEAMSQLDSESERIVCDMLERYCADATLIVIAHRPLPETFRRVRYRLMNETLVRDSAKVHP